MVPGASFNSASFFWCGNDDCSLEAAWPTWALVWCQTSMHRAQYIGTVCDERQSQCLWTLPHRIVQGNLVRDESTRCTQTCFSCFVAGMPTAVISTTISAFLFRMILGVCNISTIPGHSSRQVFPHKTKQLKMIYDAFRWVVASKGWSAAAVLARICLGMRHWVFARFEILHHFHVDLCPRNEALLHMWASGHVMWHRMITHGSLSFPILLIFMLHLFSAALSDLARLKGGPETWHNGTDFREQWTTMRSCEVSEPDSVECK